MDVLLTATFTERLGYSPHAPETKPAEARCPAAAVRLGKPLAGGSERQHVC